MSMSALEHPPVQPSKTPCQPENFGSPQTEIPSSSTGGLGAGRFIDHDSYHAESSFKLPSAQAEQLLSRQVRWKLKQRQLRRELATSEWEVGYGGRVVRLSSGRVPGPASAASISVGTAQKERGIVGQKNKLSLSLGGAGRVTAAKVIAETGKENQAVMKERTQELISFNPDLKVPLSERNLNTVRPESVLVAEPGASDSGSTRIEQVIENWPRGVGFRRFPELRRKIINAGIRDIEKILQSKVYHPTGQDLTRYQQVERFLNIQLKEPEKRREDLALHIAHSYKGGRKLANRILQCERVWIRYRYVNPGLQGKGGRVRTMLEDEGTLLAVREYIALAKAPGRVITAQDLADAVGNYWQEVARQDPEQDTVENATAAEQVKATLLSLQELNDDPDKWSLSSRSAVNWLKKLGYEWREVKKGLFKDGHERVDVLDYRQNHFLPFLKEVEPRLVQWDEKGNLIRTPEDIYHSTGQIPCVLVTHDECIFHANDGPTHVWTEKGSMPLRKKGHGQGIMVSQFLTPCCSLAAPPWISDTELAGRGLPRSALKSLEFGGDTWWRNEDLIHQTLNIAIPLFELVFPGCQAVFLFDNARNHLAFADDALRANLVNLTPGGKAPVMRNGWFRNPGGQIYIQPMNFSNEASVPEVLRGKPKGGQLVLQERGKWRDGLRLKCPKAGDCDPARPGGCCVRNLLSHEEDFKAQKGKLEEAIEDRGHQVLLYPTFHCELNWIEYFWGAAKRYTRKNCHYGIQDLRTRIPLGLQYAEGFIWKFWARTVKIAQAYREGVGYGAEKAYKSHRRPAVGGLGNSSQ